MANEKVGVLVDIAVKGREGVRGAADAFKALDKSVGTTKLSLTSILPGFAAASAAMVGAGLAAKRFYDIIHEGAILTTTSERFDKLTESIGATSDVMLGELRGATKGMIADMDLMASASQIISLKLADNSDQVVRLATVAGTLNWDMQQVILTFANMSTMRLDALGLSVEEVTSKAKELEAQGMSAQAAFKEAVILAGEARLDVGGVSEAEQAFKKAEAAVANYKSALLLSTVATLDQAGAFEKLIDIINKETARSELSGLIAEFEKLTGTEWGLTGGINLGTKELAAEIERVKAAIEGATLIQQHYQVTLDNTTRATGGLTQAQLEALQGMGLAIPLTGQLAEGQSFLAKALGSVVPMIDAQTGALLGYISTIEKVQGTIQAVTNRYAYWVDATNKRNRANEEEHAALLEETKTLGGYSGALAHAVTAEEALAAAHSRMASAFSAEVSAKPEEGLIDAAGIVNIEAANKALFEQAQAAGATAGQLAMLGVATGQFTTEQAQAALKAAILGEKIKQLAAGVASGEISVGDATGGLDAFRQQLDAGQIQGAADSVASLAGAADDLAANGPYVAEMSVEDKAAWTAINELQTALNSLTGTHYINLVTTTAGTGGTAGPEIVPDNSGNGNRAALISGKSGGASYNVSVVNYVDGRAVNRTALDDVTTDRIKAALNGVGMR